jgi:hypothetical protein
MRGLGSESVRAARVTLRVTMGSSTEAGRSGEDEGDGTKSEVGERDRGRDRTRGNVAKRRLWDDMSTWSD